MRASLADRSACPPQCTDSAVGPSEALCIPATLPVRPPPPTSTILAARDPSRASRGVHTRLSAAASRMTSCLRAASRPFPTRRWSIAWQAELHRTAAWRCGAPTQPPPGALCATPISVPLMRSSLADRSACPPRCTDTAVRPLAALCIPATLPVRLPPSTSKILAARDPSRASCGVPTRPTAAAATRVTSCLRAAAPSSRPSLRPRCLWPRLRSSTVSRVAARSTFAGWRCARRQRSRGAPCADRTSPTPTRASRAARWDYQRGSLRFRTSAPSTRRPSRGLPARAASPRTWAAWRAPVASVASTCAPTSSSRPIATAAARAPTMSSLHAA